MSNSSDPSIYRQREKQVVSYVERLLGDDRLRVDTLNGRRPVIFLRRDVTKDDREVELKRLMSDLDVPDRELQSRMPLGQQLTVTLSRSFFLLFKKRVGRIKVVCLSPWRELIEGTSPSPVSRSDLESALAHQRAEESDDVPVTLVMTSTSGFAADARDLVERRANRTIVLIEPNEAGGWTVTGPPELASLTDLLDPEVDADKRQRVKEAIEHNQAELLSGGLPAERVAAATKLPLGMVEDELQSYAAEAGGLVARRLQGQMVLYRESTMPAAGAGGTQMPFMQKLRALFGAKADNEKKVSVLSEKRAALSIQQDRAYSEMGVLESKEAELRQQFKDTTSSITRRRITSQLVQLRKDLERRQQLLGVLNQQINVISTHLHNLELVQQGQSAALPDSEELANDAAAAEEVLAELQADNELAGSISAAGPSGMSAEEQALYEELEREAAGPKVPEAAKTGPAATTTAQKQPAAEPAQPPRIPTRPEKQRGEAEPG